jgi:pimeloyl-ACP methyl ester carboxylesterase
MEKWIGSLLVDVSPPERPKFKLPLIFVHGPWTSSLCWKPWDTQFCNLGWECWAVNMRGRFEERPLEILKHLKFGDCVSDIERVIGESPYPPILLAHSLGGLIARQAAEEGNVSALIQVAGLAPKAIQPTLPPAMRLLRLKYAALLFLRRAFCIEGRDFQRNWLNGVREERQPELLTSLVPESPYLIGDFFDRDIAPPPNPIRCPILVVAGGEDRVAPVASQREQAERLGAEMKEYPERGHWMMGEAGGEGIVRDIHRWIVTKLGEEILLPEPATED